MLRAAVWILTLLALPACSGSVPPGGEASTADADDSMELQVVEPDTGLPPIPEYPAPQRGHLVIRAVGALSLSASWAAHAVRCTEPRLIVLTAQGDDIGASVLLRLHPDSAVSSAYPISRRDSTVTMAPATARVGLLQFRATRADTYEASDGAVELFDSDSVLVSGRFAVTMEYGGDRSPARAAAVFRRIRVSDADADWCSQVAAREDALSDAPTDSARADARPRRD